MPQEASGDCRTVCCHPGAAPAARTCRGCQPCSRAPVAAGGHGLLQRRGWGWWASPGAGREGGTGGWDRMCHASFSPHRAVRRSLSFQVSPVPRPAAVAHGDSRSPFPSSGCSAPSWNRSQLEGILQHPPAASWAQPHPQLPHTTQGTTAPTPLFQRHLLRSPGPPAR